MTATSGSSLLARATVRLACLFQMMKELWLTSVGVALIRRQLNSLMNQRILLRYLAILCAGSIGLTSCQTIHQFLVPARDWQARHGQLLYRGKRTTLIGEVLVRFSKAGDFELTFTKGPGIALLEVRQDANFASVRGPLARGGWSGPTAKAPARLRGWLQLRELLLASGEKTSVQHSLGAETFVFRF